MPRKKREPDFLTDYQEYASHVQNPLFANGRIQSRFESIWGPKEVSKRNGIFYIFVGASLSIISVMFMPYFNNNFVVLLPILVLIILGSVFVIRGVIIIFRK